MSAPLTRLQLDCMRVLVEMIDRDAVAPTLRELAHELDLRGIGSVQQALTELARKGWIRRERFRARSIAILVRPPMPDFRTPEFIPSAGVRHG